ncbi:MAG TPA: ATP-binding protein [Alphaproteobacteria bacterium]|nr:ATP-binding protein [Alphaproteobacteria bacterium]
MAHPFALSNGLVGTIALLASPAALVLLALGAFGALEPGVAVIAVLVDVALTAAVARPLVLGVARLTAYLDGLAEGRQEAQPSPVWPPLVAALAVAVGRVRRRWQQRRDELSGRIATLDAMLDSLPDPFLMLDSHQRVLRANAAARELLSVSPAGRELSSMLRMPALIEAAQAAIRRGAGARVSFELASPVRRSFICRVERLSGLTGDEAAIVMVMHDLTAEKRAEQMRADFVANASHELRTPLATLLGFIETLQGPASADPEARRRFLGIMQEQAGRMSRLVDDLLSLSRIELREHTPPTEPLDLLRVLRSVADALQPQSKAREITIAMTLPESGLPPVLGDGDELAQVFQNLIDNAIKYGRRGTEVRVVAQQSDRCPVPISRTPPGGFVTVAVSDEGEGIPREKIPRLTERFYRVDAARSRELGGTGLGLAIVKHIVNRHRGALQIESAIGRGSTFTVFLPTATAGRGDEGTGSNAAPGHGTVTSPS